MMLQQRLSGGGRTPLQTQRRQRPQQRHAVVAAAGASTGAAGGGFASKSNKRRVDTSTSIVVPADGKRVKAADRGQKQQQQQEPSLSPGDGWVELKLRVADAFPLGGGKSVRIVELATGRALALYRLDNMLYVSDAASTAFKFPMVDARVFKTADGAPAAEVPLDGTVYDLRTGAVIEWAPKNNPVRAVLGTLKSKETPVPLSVFPVHVAKDGGIWTKLI